MSLAPEQVAQLLKPIHPSRVMSDNKGMAHVSQQDVRAHLIRLFGFGGWDTELTSLELIHERSVGVDEKSQGRWWVTYRCTMRLTIKDPQGKVLATYEDGATGSAQNQPSPGDAHDNALKNAISYALKRCAINLGDQFGLSLYNKGQRTALVKGLVIGSAVDVQEGIEQQVDLGHEEGLIAHEQLRDEATHVDKSRLQRSSGRNVKKKAGELFLEPETDEKWLASITARINECPSLQVWRGLATEIKQETDLGHVSAVDADLLDKRLTAREIDLGEVAS
jgi:recombination DNA repair RAD52 pathway protein